MARNSGRIEGAADADAAAVGADAVAAGCAPTIGAANAQANKTALKRKDRMVWVAFIPLCLAQLVLAHLRHQVSRLFHLSSAGYGCDVGD